MSDEQPKLTEVFRIPDRTPVVRQPDGKFRPATEEDGLPQFAVLGDHVLVDGVPYVGPTNPARPPGLPPAGGRFAEAPDVSRHRD